MNLLDAKRKLLPLSGYMGMGGGGGGGSQQSTNTTYSTNIPEYAKPYVETMLGATQKQLFQGSSNPQYEDVPVYSTQSTGGRGGGTQQVQTGTERRLIPGSDTFNITGFQPYRSYGGTYDAQGNQTSYDPGKSIAGFQPMQTGAQQGIANMQLPGQYGQATDATQQSMQNLQNANYQAGNFGNQFQNPGTYQPGQFSMMQAQAPDLQNYQMGPAERVRTQSFAQPGSAEAYMSPYMQNVVDIQKREAQRQSGIQGTQQQAQAVGAGAFGGSRDAIVRAERERNLGQQMGDIQATGQQAAYGQAQQQFNAEQQARLQAQQANQQAGIQTGTQNLSALLGIQQLGAGQNMQSQLANQQAFQQAQQAAEQSRQYGAGQGLQAASLGAQYGQAAQAAEEQSRQFGAGYGMQANQAALGAANQLANLGQQQLAAQQGIYSLQNTTGAQQQALEQQKVNQAIQDYSNAQQYPLMQLGTMSNMIRGLPMQAQTTQQYVAAPNPITQAIGAAGAGASLYNAFKAKGGVIKEYAKGGIMSYNVGGEVESDLYNMDESSLQKQLKESSSPSIKRMAQRILRERQLEKQPQQPRLAGGGIIAFASSTDENNQSVVKEKPELTPSEILHRRSMTGEVTKDVSNVPLGIAQAAPAVAPPPVLKAPLTALEATQADPNIPDVLKSQISDIQTRADRSIPDIMREKQAAYEAAGVAQRDPEARANLMKERANAEDEARRNRYLQAAAFFARWGSTPGETLTAGLIAVRERIPEIVEGEKEAKKVRMEINKSIASLDEATRLETIGEIDAAAAVKEKDAEKMQTLFLKLSEYQMQTQKENAAETKALKVEEVRSTRAREHDISIEKMRRELQNSVNETQLAGERIRAAAAKEDKEGRNETNMIARLNAAAQLQANVEKTIEVEMSKPAYATLVNRAGMAETPDTLPLIKAAKEQLAIRERNFDRMRKDAQDTVNFVREKAGMKPKPTNTGGDAPPPPPGAKVD